MSASWKEGASLLCKDRSIKFLGSGYMRESLQHLKPHKKQTPGTKIIVLATLPPNHPFSCSFQESFAWFAALGTLSGTPCPDKGPLVPPLLFDQGQRAYLIQSHSASVARTKSVSVWLATQTHPQIGSEITSMIVTVVWPIKQGRACTRDRPHKEHPKTANRGLSVQYGGWSGY